MTTCDILKCVTCHTTAASKQHWINRARADDNITDTDTYIYVCARCCNDDDNYSYNRLLYKDTLELVCCDICKQKAAVKRVREHDKDANSSKYKVITDKLHELDVAVSESANRLKEQKTAYISDLCAQARTRDTIYAQRCRYTLHYLDDSTAIITKHTSSDNAIVAYHVMTQHKLEQHISKQEYRMMCTLTLAEIRSTKDVHDAIRMLATLKVCEYMTKEQC